MRIGWWAARLLFLVAPCLQSQTPYSREVVLRVEPYARQESEDIVVPGKATLTVAPQGESGREKAPAIFVSSNNGVEAKNDETGGIGYVTWVPAKASTARVLLVNDSPKTLSYRITVTKQVVRHLEPVAVLGRSVLRLYYATDREPAVDPRFEPHFSADSAGEPAFTLGTCEVAVPRDPRMQRLEIPTMWRLESSSETEARIGILKVVREAESAIWPDLQRKIATTPDKQLLFLLPGADTTFDDAVKWSAQLSYDLAFDGPILVYSLSSQTGAAQLHQQSASLEKFLHTVALQTKAQQIHVIAQGAAGERILEALADLPVPALKNIALIAPAIAPGQFRPLSSSIQPAPKLTLYTSGDPMVYPEIETIGASAGDLRLLGTTHQYYADRGTVLSDLVPLLRNIPAASRPGLRSVDPSGRHWTLKP